MPISGGKVIITQPNAPSVPTVVTKSDVGLCNVDNVQQIPMSQKGMAGGVATLDASGKLLITQSPLSLR